MSKKIDFKKPFIKVVSDASLVKGKVSNRLIASRLGVDEATIRRWRKDHPEFDKAFSNALDDLKNRINAAAELNLKVRKRKVITDGPKGRTVTVEEIIPSHNDIAVFSKALGAGPTVHGVDEERKEDQRAILRSTVKRKIAGEITALDAALILEAEGIAVPETLLLELQKGSKDKEPTVTLTPEQRAARVEELKRKLYGGTEPEPDAG